MVPEPFYPLEIESQIWELCTDEGVVDCIKSCCQIEGSHPSYSAFCCVPNWCNLSRPFVCYGEVFTCHCQIQLPHPISAMIECPRMYRRVGLLSSPLNQVIFLINAFVTRNDWLQNISNILNTLRNPPLPVDPCRRRRAVCCCTQHSSPPATLFTLLPVEGWRPSTASATRHLPCFPGPGWKYCSPSSSWSPCRGQCTLEPSSASLTYHPWRTRILLSAKGLATNGEALNFLRSRVSGEYAAAFARANSSCSCTDFFGVCSSWKHIPGTRKGVPNITSAVEVDVSSLGALLGPSMTHGKDLVHELLARTAHPKEFLRALWNRSTIPFDCRW